jgi:uncharacterized membrane protein
MPENNEKDIFSQDEKNFIKTFQMGGSDRFFSILQSMFQQHYEHSRHQEWQRTSFTTILGAIVGAIFSFYDKLPANGLQIGVLVVGLALSSIGFVLMYTWNRPFIRHHTWSDMIVIYYWKMPWLRRKFNYNPSTLSLREFIFEPTSGNLFYVLTAIFCLLFAVTIGYLLSNTSHYMSYIFGGITLVTLFVVRIIFAYKERGAKKEILEMHWKGPHPNENNPFI